MVYNDFNGIKLSALGMGTMRLPVVNGNDAVIDEETSLRMFDYAYEHGVNYFDTAWGYHAGNSELVTGKALKRYPRDSFYLATKFPGYDVSNFPKAEEIFEKQLEKCQVDHFDFYLLHNVCEANIEYYLDPKYGIYDYFTEQKKNGRIRHLGFSAHAIYDNIVRFLEVYGDDMEFGQLQLNWLDWSFQDGERKYNLLKERNIPVVVMEPLRGGKLCNLKPEYEAKLKAVHPDWNQVEWAFRFLQRLSAVSVTLSGMSDEKQMMENIDIYEKHEPLSDADMKVLDEIVEDMKKEKSLPCTSCHYCTSHCPAELDIPYLISLYNEAIMTGKGGFIAPMALGVLDDSKKPGACLHCESCEAVCPQQIKISDMMIEFAKMTS